MLICVETCRNSPWFPQWISRLPSRPLGPARWVWGSWGPGGLMTGGNCDPQSATVEPDLWEPRGRTSGRARLTTDQRHSDSRCSQSAANPSGGGFPCLHLEDSYLASNMLSFKLWYFISMGIVRQSPWKSESIPVEIKGNISKILIFQLWSALQVDSVA